MTSIGIMIEGQEGLTWDRFFKLADAAESMGFESLFRSDHLVGLGEDHTRDTLALWPSLTALAMRTERIRFGPMVSPMTFRHPALVAKMATAVSDLSNGRLDLGLGTGWHPGEHQMLGLYYPPFRTRLEMLDEGTQLIKQLWSGEITNFSGRHYQLIEAEDHPSPHQTPPIIMGGTGPTTLRVIAKHADEWNCVFTDVATFREKNELLESYCQEIGRDSSEIRRSLMIPYVIGENEAVIADRLAAHRATFPDFPATLEAWQDAGHPGGTPEQVGEQLAAFAAAGVERFMLQHNDLDDMASLILMAEEVLPRFSGR